LVKPKETLVGAMLFTKVWVTEVRNVVSSEDLPQ